MHDLRLLAWESQLGVAPCERVVGLEYICCGNDGQE